MLQLARDPLQDTTLCPAVKPHVDRVPVAELARQAAPGATLGEHSEPSVERLTMRNLAVVARRRQQRREPGVPSVSQLLLIRHLAPGPRRLLSPFRHNYSSI